MSSRDRIILGGMMMYRHILVPLDGSARAESVLPMAARLARNTRGTLILVQVVSLASEYWPAITTPYPSMAQAAVDSELAEAESYLEHTASSPELVGITVQTATQFGPVASTILSVASSYAADLIMICSHGYSGVTHWLIGSTAEKIARYAAIPVLILREGSKLPLRLKDGPRALRLLVPLDGSTHAKAALEPATDLLTALTGSQAPGTLHLARIVKPETHSDKNQEALLQNTGNLNKARRYLSLTAEQLSEGYIVLGMAERHIPVTWSVSFDDDVAGALVNIAEHGPSTDGLEKFGPCDLIAISTHGRSGVMRWTMGSIAERVLHATTLPILIVRSVDMLQTPRAYDAEKERTYLLQH
jgi:nucleotide-binding universal stress UspA family protein